MEQTKGMSEDWLALWLGLFIFVLSLGVFQGADILGWGINTSVWTDPGKAMSTVSKTYQPVKGEVVKIDGRKVTVKKADGKEDTITVADAAALKVGDTYEKAGLSGFTALFLTYLAMLALMTVGAVLLKTDVKKFAVGFTVVFWVSYACWFAGHFAYIAATKDKLGAFKIPWSLSLTGESGFIFALLAGLVVGNFFPKLSEKLKEAARPELYIKTAIVIMGAGLGLKAAESFSLASNIMFRGMCAIVEAYLIYWAVVYYMARKYFKFNREWAAPLASGISICGVSAAIATGGAIRARPVVPIMVSSLVVIFAVVEMIILPFAAQTFLWKEPLVAGAWMGLAVKTDGGAVASGARHRRPDPGKSPRSVGHQLPGRLDHDDRHDGQDVHRHLHRHLGLRPGHIWCTKIECKPGEKARPIEIWHRFPKFVIGYVLTFFLLVFLCWPATTAIGPVEKDIKAAKTEIAAAEKQLPSAAAGEQPALQEKIKTGQERVKSLGESIKTPKATIAAAKTATGEGNVFRVMFFVFTFFTIGVVSNFKKLWEEGIGKLMVVYVVALFGFIIWVGLFISWLFFHGVTPPVVG